MEKRRDGAQRVTLGILLHETGWPSVLEGALSPLVGSVLEVVSLEAGLHAPAGFPLLDRIASLRSERPLLALTGQGLSEASGHELRGLSWGGRGLAVASTFGLEASGLLGVVRHELGHALGLDHCANARCAMSARPWPMDVADRGRDLCVVCREAWWAASERWR